MQTSNLDIPKLPDLSRSRGRLPVPVLLYLLAVVIPVQFHLGPLSLNGVRLILLILIIPLSVQLMMGKFGRIFWTDILFVLHIFWATVSLGVNNPDRVIESIGSTSIEFIGGYVLGRAYIRDVETFTSLIRVLGIIIVAILPIAFYEAFTGRALVLETIRRIPGLTSFPTVFDLPRMGLDRVQATFPHPIHYGLFASVGFSLYLVGLKDIVSTPVRYVISALIGLSVFLSLSSGALLSIILQIGMISWAWILKPVRYKWLVLFGVFAALYVMIDLLSNRSPMRVFMTYATFSPHNAYWRAAIFEWGMYNVWNNPIFGLGQNDWVRPTWMHSPSVDNFWLLAAMRYGIPGFAFLAIGYLIALWQVGRRNLNQDIRLQQFRRAWMFTFVGLTFTLATVHVWSIVYSFVFFMLGAGIWFTSVKVEGPVTTVMAEPGRDMKLKHRRVDITSGLTQSTNPEAPTRPVPTTELKRRHQSTLPESRTAGSDEPKYSRFSGSPRKRDGP